MWISRPLWPVRHDYDRRTSPGWVRSSSPSRAAHAVFRSACAGRGVSACRFLAGFPHGERWSFSSAKPDGSRRPGHGCAAACGTPAAVAACRGKSPRRRAAGAPPKPTCPTVSVGSPITGLKYNKLTIRASRTKWGELYRDEQHFAEPFPDDASGAFARFRHCPRVVPYRSPRPFPEVPCVGRPAGRGQ